MANKSGSNRHLLGYNQQDAHEFFQVISSFVTQEEPVSIHNAAGSLFDIEALYLKGKDTIEYFFYGTRCSTLRLNNLANPLKGLLASQITCLSCGYQTPLRHETFDNLSISVPTSVI